MCTDHYKKKELICLTDNCLICPECALFGQHRNHEFKKKKEFVNFYKNRIPELLEDLRNL